MRDFVTPSCELLAVGEPTHREPAFGLVRNELFARLVETGFRSVALETDRVAALAVNDFVQGGAGTLDAVMRHGFSHDFGELDANRRLVAWMRAYNRNRPPEDWLAFHGFDTPTENYSAPSPRRYLEHARDYLNTARGLALALDIARLAGDDERWSRAEAVLDPAESPGATPEAERLRSVAGDLLTALHTHRAELTAATSDAAWQRAATHLTAGLGLLRYHRQAARPLAPGPRLSRLLATRDGLMAANLLDIRSVEARRGPTLVHAHNSHLQPHQSTWSMGGLDCVWTGAGAVVGSLLGDRYAFVAGSLGRSEALGLGEPEPDSYEGVLQLRCAAWGLTASTTIGPARARTGTTPELGYFPLDRRIVEAADAVLHIGDGAAVAAASPDHPR
ncbi:erythromycin esterase family protein [Kitasatospora sp. NPDC047058]|uniref:erythromycin esterase family protein n=1 Tax=Kitasatospora sp. NPDC047058 TaxID=3155620 RepID=UPI0034054E25